jgi:hypothetical protein
MAASSLFAPSGPGAAPRGHGSHTIRHQDPFRVALDLSSVDASTLDTSSDAAVFHSHLTHPHDSFGTTRTAADAFDQDQRQAQDHPRHGTPSDGPGSGSGRQGVGHSRAPPLQAPPTQGPFAMLGTTVIPPTSRIGAVRQDETVFASAPVLGSSDGKLHGQLSSKIVVDPPTLDEWRERLFNVDDLIILTHDQYVSAAPSRLPSAQLQPGP